MDSQTAAPAALPIRRGLRIPEAAGYIGVANWFMEELVRQKKIPAHKLGRPWIIFQDDLDAYVERLRGAA